MKLDDILTALAICLGLALPGKSWAVITFFEPLGGIDIPNTYAGVSVDLETGASSTSLSGLSEGDANFFLGGAAISNDGDASATAATWQPVRTGTGFTDAVQDVHGLTVGIPDRDDLAIVAHGRSPRDLHVGADANRS